MKGFFASFFCYLFLYAILFLIENKIDELFEALIFLSISGFFIILIQTIIMELCFKIEGYNRLFAIMIGFIERVLRIDPFFSIKPARLTKKGQAFLEKYNYLEETYPDKQNMMKWIRVGKEVYSNEANEEN